MSDTTALRIRQAFERLTADHPALTSNDQALMQAFERLMHGLSEAAGGAVAVVPVPVEVLDVVKFGDCSSAATSAANPEAEVPA